MKIPDYTLEQKARAFDTLWLTCSAGRGVLKTWRNVQISSEDPIANTAAYTRIPVYEFTILAEGDMYSFKDVLHKLATTHSSRNEADQQN